MAMPLSTFPFSTIPVSVGTLGEGAVAIMFVIIPFSGMRNARLRRLHIVVIHYEIVPCPRILLFVEEEFHDDAEDFHDEIDKSSGLCAFALLGFDFFGCGGCFGSFRHLRRTCHCPHY
jgi:hypothetical protein